MVRQPITVGELVTRAAQSHPSRAALKDRNGRQLSYAQLDERTDRLANSLRNLGLGPGERVATWMADVFEYVEVYVAAAKAGLVVAPINARLVAPEAAYQLEDSEASALVVTGEVVSELERLPRDALAGRHVIAVGADSGHGTHRWEDLATQGSAEPLAPPDPDALYILGYTSGTTGRPKGAMLTQTSVLAICRLNASSFRLPAHATIALTGSMSFVAVVPSHVIMTLRLAGTVVIMGRWSADELLDVIERELAVFTYIPSPLLSEVTDAIRRRPEAIRSLHGLLHSASRADPQKLAALHEVVGGRLIEGLGMTENSGGLVTATAAVDYVGARDGDRIFASVGRTAVEVDVKLIDGDAKDLPWDGETVGELCFSSPALMSGYWKLPEATAQVLVDGWYRSGDLGTIDPDGYITIAERRTDLIVSGGANVYPSEVELCIAELPAVREVAVVGVPHERWGQTVLAVVVTDREVGLEEAEVVEHCRRQLASFKKPSRVLFVDELPRTAGLKVARAALREQVLERLAAES